MTKKTFLAALALGLATSTSAFAQTEIQWWHAMTGANNDVVNRLADEFNASQKDYKVVTSYKGQYADNMNAGIAAFRAGNAPHILQVFEVGTATMMGAKGAIKPVGEMMKEAGEKFDPRLTCPPSPAITRPPRARCCPSRSTPPPWSCGSTRTS